MITDIMHSYPVRFLIKTTFKDQDLEFVCRPASYLLKKKDEGDHKLQRIIILPPHGYTADHIDELNPHPEVRQAKISIKGGIREGYNGFSILKNILKFCYLQGRNAETIGGHLSVRVSSRLLSYREAVKSSKESFFVVRENGFGFYHSLINLSTDWIVLLLDKELRLSKRMNIEATFLGLDTKSSNSLRVFMQAIQTIGDSIFTEHQELIQAVTALDPQVSIPTLIEALNIYDSGRHEACSIYAMILKIGKASPIEVQSFLLKALDEKQAPKYYVEEQLHKLS